MVPSNVRISLASPLNAFFLLVVICSVGCRWNKITGASQSWLLDPIETQSRATEFGKELDALRIRLEVPGIAYAIIRDGHTIASDGMGVELGGEANPYSTSSTHQIASITKSLTAVIAMQLSEQGLLDLESPVKKYLPSADLPEDVKVIHLLTHTSEGNPGEEYVYGTSRFAMLGDIIEVLTSLPFREAITERVLNPADMTVFDSPNLHPHYGLVSNVDDLARYIQAMDKGMLLSEASLERMATPTLSVTGRPLRNSVGWFAQEIQGVPVMWAYGQNDAPMVGALVMRVPSHKLTLVLLSNSYKISDLPILVFGDVQNSAIGMSFFRLFVASSGDVVFPALEIHDEITSVQVVSERAGRRYDYANDLLNEVYLSYYLNKQARAERLLRLAHSTLDLTRRRDSVLHLYLGFFGHLAQSEDLISLGRQIGEGLLERHPNNPLILEAQAGLLRKQGLREDAALLYRHVINLRNQHDDIFRRRANARCMQSLAEIYRDSDPVSARQYLKRIIASGVGGETLENAKRLLAELKAK